MSRFVALGLVAWMAALGIADAQSPITPNEPPLPSSGITLRVAPVATIPASSTAPPLARILYAQPSPAAPANLLVNDIGGVLYRVGAGAAAGTYLDLSTQGIGFVAGPDPGSPGFNGFALHPNFAGNAALPGYGKLYTTSWVNNSGTGLTFTGNTAGSLAVSIREWTTTNPAAAAFTGTSREVMRIAGYTTGHSNGMIAFNPTAKPSDADYGNLYIGSGDGEYFDPSANAQNLGLPQGKVLRINPLAGPAGASYTVPADNPWAGTPGALPEIWARGLRNPQSFTWDQLTGAMYINDIGQALVEEINRGISGANYGWPYREGSYAKAIAFGGAADDESAYSLPATDATLGYTYPVGSYSHTEGNAIGSGLLYRGSEVPALYGHYLAADIVSGRIFDFNPATGAIAVLPLVDDAGPLTLTTKYGYDSWLVSPRVDARLSADAAGEPLLLLKSNGAVYRLGNAVAVPEPGSALLACCGLGLVTVVVRAGRRRPW